MATGHRKVDWDSLSASIASATWGVHPELGKWGAMWELGKDQGVTGRGRKSAEGLCQLLKFGLDV